jgi:hypothetical protein
MTEQMIQDSALPTEIDLLITVCDGALRYPYPVKVPVDATWDQVMQTWRVQACNADPNLARYPGVATAYIMKSETGSPVSSMDNMSKIYAHILSSTITQPNSDGTVMIKLTHKALDSTRKYFTRSVDLRVLPDETEQELIDRWFEELRAGRIKLSSSWLAHLKSRPKEASSYEWFTGESLPLQKPWHDQERILFREPNQPSTTPINAPLPPSAEDGSSSGNGKGPGSSAPGPGPKPSSSSGQADSVDGHHAPPYTTSTRKSHGQVDVTITLGTFTFGHSVDSKISAEMLQRIAGNAAHVTLEGYWIPVVINGEGRIGNLCPHDEIELRPGSQAEIDQIINPRTNANAPLPTNPFSKTHLKPGSLGCNYLEQQASRETYVPWDQFAPGVDKEKFVHVVTDGGARPNPGNAGWGAILRQSGHFSWTFGHCSRATNNAMELRAVIEAL